MSEPGSVIDRLNGFARRVPVWPLYGLALLPGVWALWSGLTTPGPDPVRNLEHALGEWAVKFLVFTLAVTPLRERLGLNLLRFRRMLGLTAFWYALGHLAVYLVLDRQLVFGTILGDVLKRPYIIAGFSAFLLLLPLAITSSNRAIASMGADRWQRLHRLIHPAALLVALHWLWLSKTIHAEVVVYSVLLAGLVAYRLLPKPQRRRTARRAA